MTTLMDQIQAIQTFANTIENASLMQLARNALKAAQESVSQISALTIEVRRLWTTFGEVETALGLEGELIYSHDMYYRVAAIGNDDVAGEPFCSRCWQVDHRAFALARKFQPEVFRCNRCMKEFDLWFQ